MSPNDCGCGRFGRLDGYEGALGVFGGGYWGHPAMKLPPEVNLLGVAHYMQALEFQRKANQTVAILGSKTPHIQNLAVRGVANPINPESQSTIRHLNRLLAMAGKVAGAEIPLSALHSTIGRHAARAVRCALLHETLEQQQNVLIANIAKGDVATDNRPMFPKGEIRGFGYHEAPRGVLSHWAVIANGKLKNYQAVVPNTWNAGPRDDNDALGPCEASLVGNPVADPEKPLVRSLPRLRRSPRRYRAPRNRQCKSAVTGATNLAEQARYELAGEAAGGGGR